MEPTKDPSLRTKLDPRKATTLLLLIFQCLVGIVLMIQRGCPPELGVGNGELGVDSQLPNPNSQLIYVHVVGKVVSPGVYKFSASSFPTVQDAINAAGGSIAPVSIDLKLPLHDEEQVVIK